MKKAILVLGMHRSGTSALAAGMGALGCDIINDMPPNEENPKGFFEHQDIQVLNDDILKSIDTFWGNPCYTDELRKINDGSTVSNELLERTRQVLKDYEVSNQFAIKDPRLSLLYPFWEKNITDIFNARVFRLIIIRNPSEVIDSLLKRNVNSPDLSLGDNKENILRLWLLYNFMIIQNIKDSNNYLVEFDYYLKQPKIVLTDICEAFKFEAYEEKNLDDYTNQFVDRNLKHFNKKLTKKEIVEISPALSWAYDFYSDLKKFSAKKLSRKDARFIVEKYKNNFNKIFESSESLGRLIGFYYNKNLNYKNQINSLDQAYSNSIKEIIVTQDKLDEATRELENSNRELEESNRELEESNWELKHAEKEIETIKSSLLWKMILPLRALKDFIKYKKTYFVLKRSNYFDSKYYKNSNPDIDKLGMDPLKHFIRHGVLEGRNPIVDFDVKYYLNNNLDLNIAQINPLYHYITHGWLEKRKPKPDADMQQELLKLCNPVLFWDIRGQIASVRAAYRIYRDNKINAFWYFKEYPDVFIKLQSSFWWRHKESKLYFISAIAKVMVHPVTHYVWHGSFEGKNPNSAFETTYYLFENKDVFLSKVNPFYHYITCGYKEGRKPTSRTGESYREFGVIRFSGIDNSVYTTTYQLTENIDMEKPFVSVIVPNYNHSNYLKQRLESIYNQTYQHFEVILMDDCSQDNSRDILQTYLSRYPDKTRLLFNDINSGGVFHQWEKGLSLASGDLIWIAESDDWCSLNFLEELTKYFYDEAIVLAYCRSVFIKSDTNKQIWTTEEYLSDVDDKLWKAPFVCASHKVMNKAWAIKNIIPNVSSALFRNPSQLNLLKDESWKKMRTCGDWLFYAHLARGGLIAYTPEATNYYRIHDNNTSVMSYTDDIFYKEHEVVAQNIKKLFNISQDVFESMRKNLKQHWLHTRQDFSEEHFNNCFDLERIKKYHIERKPNLLMVGYAFNAGGGEVFPITLANMLKGMGYGITFLSCEQEKRESGVRKMLRSDIPVVTNYCELNDLVDDLGIEIVHSHHAWADHTIIDLLNNTARCKHVVTMHGMYETIDKGRQKKLLQKLLMNTQKIVYTAEKNLEPFKRLGLLNKDKMVNIGNALALSPVNNINLIDIGVPDEAFVICLVSRAIKEKGWVEAIETVKEARKISGADVHLVLIGEGPEYDRLKDCSPAFIHFLGFRNNIRDYFAAANLGYLPSRFLSESFPLVVIDCLLSGRPVLASDVGEIQNMIKAGNDLAGSIFRLVNWEIPVDEVAKIIARYATDSSFYREKLNMVEEAAIKFKPDVLLKKYDEVYNEKVSNGSDSP